MVVIDFRDQVGALRTHARTILLPVQLTGRGGTTGSGNACL